MVTLKLYLVLGAGLALLAIAPSAAQARQAATADALSAGQIRAAPAGAAAAADATRQLKRKFDAADLDHSGLLTQEEARRAGLRFVAAHFGLIDTARRGSVSFDQIMVFMQQVRTSPVARPG